MTKFSAKDYLTVASLIREESTGHPADEGSSDLEFGRQEALESLVKGLTQVYQEDNSAFETDRFWWNALGYERD